ncbi:MAG TPA: hypothetical protein VFQ61_06285 [Polyangiaceae bacterium]|nr:hypothetical protein [Polyangiaceae bacterium]
MFTTRPGPDEISLVVDGVDFRHWTEIELTFSMDSFSTANFVAPFEPNDRDHRETFEPFTYKRMRVLLGGQALFTGTMVDINPEATAESSTVHASGYALAGVLDDCCAPASTVPHEFHKVGFRAICEYLASPFGITVQVRGDEGAVFPKVKIREDEEIFPFLTELAQQRNFVLTNTPDGMLLVWRSVPTGSPVARLSGDVSPVSEVSASFSPQDYFSELTGYAGARRGRRGTKYTAQNKWLTGVLRPKSFHLEDTEKAGAKEVVLAKMGRMFANAASYRVENIPTWRDPQGDLWTPNTTVVLKAPKVMLYRETEMLIRKVTLKQKTKERTAALEVCLPGCFSGEMPSALPWKP